MWIEVPKSAGSGLRGYGTEHGVKDTASGRPGKIWAPGRIVRIRRHSGYRRPGTGRPGQEILTGFTTSATRTSRVKQMNTPATT